MSTRTVLTFVAVCDGCGTTHNDEEYASWSDAQTARDVATNTGSWDGWSEISIDGTHYLLCNTCFDPLDLCQECDEHLEDHTFTLDEANEYLVSVCGPLTHRIKLATHEQLNPTESALKFPEVRHLVVPSDNGLVNAHFVPEGSHVQVMPGDKILDVRIVAD